MVILITLLAIVLAQPRDYPPNNTTRHKPTHDESVFIPKLLKIFEGFTQNQSEELKQKSKAVILTVIPQGYDHYLTLDKHQQIKIKKAVNNISNTVEKMNQEEKNRLQNDYTKFLELNTTEEEAVLTLISQNLTELLNSTNQFTTPIIINNMELILEQYIINHPQVNSTWHILSIQEIEQEKRIQRLFKQGKSNEEIRTIITNDIKNQDQKIQQQLLEQLDQSLKQQKNNDQDHNKNETHSPHFFVEEMVISTILNSFIISEKEEVQDNSTKNLHYIFSEFKQYYELQNQDQKDKIDQIMNEAPKVWDEMSEPEQDQIKESYIYFIKLPQKQQEILLTLISTNLTSYISKTQKPNAQQIFLITEDIVNNYKINPRTDTKSTWNFPEDNDTNFDINQRYSELLAEGKTNDEIRSILLKELYQTVQNQDQQNEMLKQIDEKIELEKEQENAKENDKVEAKTEEQLQKERDTFAIIIFILIGVAIFAAIFCMIRRQYLKVKKIKGNNSKYSMPEIIPEQIE